MAEEEVRPKMLRGYKFLHHPKQPELGILRLDAEDRHYWFYVTRATLLIFSQGLAGHAEELKEM